MKHLLLLAAVWIAAFVMLAVANERGPVVAVLFIGAAVVSFATIIHMFLPPPGGRPSAQQPREIMDKLTQLEARLDQISIEIERVGEGQRFLTRLAAEKQGVLPGSSAPLLRE